jgi:hypothetical protein
MLCKVEKMIKLLRQPKKPLWILAASLGLFATGLHAAPDCTALASSPVYQVINPNTQVNLLTPWENEVTNAVRYGFTDNRGTIFRASVNPAAGLAAAHRLYHPVTGDFFWTTNLSEISSAVQRYGYTDSKLDFYVSDTSAGCTQPVYRLLKGNIHRFVSDPTERGRLINSGWTDEGIKFYAASAIAAPGPLAINLGAIKDWEAGLIFADAMKMARPFGTVASPWGTPFPDLTADGWPKGDAGVMFISNQDQTPENAHQFGVYKLIFKGQVTPQTKVKLNGATTLAYTYDPANSWYTANINYTKTGNLYVTFEGITGGVRDVRIIRPGHTVSDVFERNFLQRLHAQNDMFGIIRFMETTITNGSKVTNWSQRTPKNYATQQGGLAWEYAIDLANQTGKDPWINIPHLADDDYVLQLARLLKANLNPDRKIYVEYSNEIWNEAPAFTQRQAVSTAACNLVLGGDPNRYSTGLPTPSNCRNQNQGNEYAYLGRHTAWKLKHIADIFQSVFGKEAMITRIRPVLAWDMWGLETRQGSTLGTLADQLQYLNSRFGSPSGYIYAVAMGAYISVSDMNNANLTASALLQQMTQYTANTLRPKMSVLHRVANQYGLKMFAYEGGPGLLGSINYNNKLAANLDPGMKGVVKILLQNWKDEGGDVFTYYNLTSAYSPNSGFFGLSASIINENSVKWQALKEKAAEWAR